MLIKRQIPIVKKSSIYIKQIKHIICSCNHPMVTRKPNRASFLDIKKYILN